MLQAHWFPVVSRKVFPLICLSQQQLSQMNKDGNGQTGRDAVYICRFFFTVYSVICYRLKVHCCLSCKRKSHHSILTQQNVLMVLLLNLFKIDAMNVSRSSHCDMIENCYRTKPLFTQKAVTAESNPAKGTDCFGKVALCGVSALSWHVILIWDSR